jgi:hypothetical protein
MRTKPAYLVIDTYGRTPTISHVRASWPRLEQGQIVIRVAIELPDSLLPQVQTISVEREDEAARVELLEVEVPEEATP